MSNPYAVAQSALRKGFYMQHGTEFMGILITLFVLQSLTIAINFVTLVVRWRANKFWIFRVHAASGGRLLVPNPVILWLLMCGIFNVFAIYYTRRTVLSGQVGSDMSNYVFWMGTIWIPFWVAVWCWSWSTALTPLLSQTPSITDKRSFAKDYPFAVSTLFVVAALGCISIILSFSCLANVKFNKLFTLFKLLDASLSQSIVALDARDFAALPSAAESAAGQELFQPLFDECLTLFQRIWIGWIVINGTLLIVLIVAVRPQTRDLRQSIVMLKNQISQEAASSHPESARRLRELLFSWRSVMITSCTTFVSTTVFMGIDAPLTARSAARAALQGDRIAEILRLGSLVTAALIGGTVSGVLFISSVSSSRNPFSPTASPRRAQTVSGTQGLRWWSSEIETKSNTVDFELGTVEKREVKTRYDGTSS